MPDISIEPLAERHDAGQFDCTAEGESDRKLLRDCQNLNKIIQVDARRPFAHRFFRTYVAVGDGGLVLGYYSLLAGTMEKEELTGNASQQEKEPEKDTFLDMHGLPSVVLKHLAVDRCWQRRCVGKKLLDDAVARSWEVSNRIGVTAMTLVTRNPRAAGLYEGRGFRRLLPASGQDGPSSKFYLPL